MHTTPVTHPPPEVLADRDAGLVAAFEMLCERMGKLEEIAEHWLRREREKEWMQDGQVDSQLMGMPADVNVWRAQSWPMRPMKVTWWAVHIATEDSCVPADLDAGDRQRLRTEEAMDRLNVRRKLLWNGDDPVTCAEAGLESDFDELADAVSEEGARVASPPSGALGWTTRRSLVSKFVGSPTNHIRGASHPLYARCSGRRSGPREEDSR
jgi:hypothetical protein